MKRFTVVNSFKIKLVLSHRVGLKIRFTLMHYTISMIFARY